MVSGLETQRKLAVCICTYKRVPYLQKLLGDLCRQSCQPDHLIIVDGAPETPAVPEMLREFPFPSGWQVSYVPTNHSCLSYHRYLNWLAASRLGCDILLYLDDDLRIKRDDAVAKTLAPFSWENRKVVGVTGNTTFGDASKFAGAGALADRVEWSQQKIPLLVRWLGAARRLPVGGLSPSGHRRTPEDQGRDYEEVAWLSGRVMAYRMDALTRECFAPDMFALDITIGGLGEDTFLSRRVGTRGQLLLAFCAHFEHPDDDLPKAYSTKALEFGFATAYSRRFLNDNFRGFNPPRLSDRLALLKSYLGTCLLNWLRAVTHPRPHRFAYARGYTQGAWQGLVHKPTAGNLTPGIDWWGDAERAVSDLTVIQEGK